MKELTNNQITITGKIAEQLKLDYEMLGEGFYNTTLQVERLSGVIDNIPVLISERILDVDQDYTGEYITVNGQLRTFNLQEGNKKRLKIFVFAQKVTFVENEIDPKKANRIFLDGHIVKAPIYRQTPLGREIADILLAVNRPYGKTDYIPCICWGRNAQFTSKLETGDHIQLSGWIQSREYMKRINDNESEIRTAYEVSVFSIKNWGENNRKAD